MTSSKSPNKRLVTGLADLPVEILDSICTLLCLHCCHPHAVDACHALVQAARRDQATLSSLSRTCSRLRKCAQPVLFHAYYTVPLDRAAYRQLPNGEVFSIRRHFNEKRLLALFLRTLLERDDLSTRVRALTLYRHPWSGFAQIDPGTDAEVASLRQRQASLVFDVAARAGKRVRVGYLAMAMASVDDGINFLERLQEVAVALCSGSLEQLCIERTMFLDNLTNAHRDWRAWSYDLPNLAYLVFPGQQAVGDTTYYYKETKSLVARTPNLRVLIAPDCEAQLERWMERQYADVEWDVSLAFLTKLSLNGIRRKHLRAILAGCPALEDLEYYYEDSAFDSDVLSPEEDLLPIGNTLRRLCYSIIRDEVDSTFNGELQDLDDGYYPRWNVLWKLEVLEVERMLLYGPATQPDDANVSQTQAYDQQYFGSGDSQADLEESDDERPEDGASPASEPTISDLDKMEKTTPEEFLSRLPGSLKALRVGHITFWPAMYRDAIALAEQAPSRFPHLQKLRLEVLETIAPPEEEIQSLIRAFGDVHIVCSVGIAEVQSSKFCRGMLPPRPRQFGTIAELDHDGTL